MFRHDRCGDWRDKFSILGGPHHGNAVARAAIPARQIDYPMLHSAGGWPGVVDGRWGGAANRLRSNLHGNRRGGSYNCFHASQLERTTEPFVKENS
ncbi:MAG: hypothetical protein KatS3mg111_0359 [Pirellulaceae bacterium]|nr:MAG: hypothetical protein KatS3mg111_0359 [Pirellulaceae bacterium]